MKIYEKRRNSFDFINKKGIYFLFRDGVIVYVGQSKNIGNRIFAHKRGKKSKLQPAKKFTHYGFLENDLCDKDMCDIEAYHIIKYKPEYNIMIPKNSFCNLCYVKDLKWKNHLNFTLTH